MELEEPFDQVQTIFKSPYFSCSPFPRATENEKEITFLYDFLKLLFTLMELFVSIIYIYVKHLPAETTLRLYIST